MKRVKEILGQCLDDVMSGKTTVDDCVRQHPDVPGLREELESLVSLAGSIPALPEVWPTSEFRLRARKAIQHEISRQGAFSRMGRGLQAFFRPLTSRPRLAAPAITAILIAIFVLGGGSAVALASQQSLPGDVLYPVKTTLERSRLLVTFSPSGKAEYHLSLAQRRLDEVLNLADSGRPIDQGAVDAIAAQVDKALADLHEVQPEQARNILSGFSSEFEKQKPVIEEAKKKANPAAQKHLDDTEAVVNRGHLIAQSISEDPSRLEQPASVKATRQGDVTGSISSLDPLVIAGAEIAVSADTKVEGTLAVGSVAEVKGTYSGNGVLTASSILVEKQEASAGKQSVGLPAIQVKGVITALDPLTVAGRKVVLAPDAELTGAPQIGLIATVSGQLQPDGSVLASSVQVERLKKDTQIKGVIVSLNPLTVGSTVVVISNDANIEGTLEVGVVASAKGQFSADGRFIASMIIVQGTGNNGQGDKSGNSGQQGQGQQNSGGQPGSSQQGGSQPGSGKDQGGDQQTPKPTPGPFATSSPRPTPWPSSTPSPKPTPSVSPEKVLNAQGAIVKIDGSEITIEIKKGETLAVKVNEETRIMVNGSSGKLNELRTGVDAKVKYDSATGIVSEIQITAAPTPRGK